MVFLSLIYSLITGDDFLEPLVILGTTLINCILGYFQESKAANATEKLKQYSANYVTVRRNGTSTDIDAKELVPGDYIILEAGDKVPADARIIESYFAKTDESILTGESNNVEKNENIIPNKTILAETYNMIYSGTIVVSGKIEAIVINTGMQTELGKNCQHTRHQRRTSHSNSNESCQSKSLYHRRCFYINCFCLNLWTY